MDVGIGYPGMFPGIRRDTLIAWATRAEEAGFACLTAGDRLVDHSNDMVMSMAVAGAVTTRIRLMSTVMILPLHATALVAKQIASLDTLTGGRFTLGVGAGNRRDDYEAVGRPYAGRTARLEEQITELKRIWAAEPQPGAPMTGPRPVTPGGPRVLIGPTTAQAARRAHLADGIVTFGGDLAMHEKIFAAALEAWEGAGRQGRPHFAAGMFFGLGPDSSTPAVEHLGEYYSFRSPAEVQALFDGFTLKPDRAVETVEAFAAAGVDDFYLCPLIAELDQIDRLVDLLGPLVKRSER